MTSMVQRAPAIMLALALCGALACGGGDSASTDPIIQPPLTDTTGLRTYAARRSFLIGSAIDRGFRYPGSDGVTFRSVMAHEFNVLTAENDMKFDHLHPSRDAYRFTSADSLIVFAESNGMKVRGHNLLWHQQLPSWLTSGTWTKTQAESLLVDHVTTVVSHYRGHVMEWDVVNEPFNDDGTMRAGFWMDHIGPGYIEQALTAAHSADPGAALFINDYNVEGIGRKSDSLLALVTGLKARGVPVDGVGFESHFVVGGVPSTLAENMARFEAAGFKVHITELDVRIQLPATGVSLTQQGTDYATVVGACVTSPACGVVVVWGFTDRESWIPNAFPGWGAATLLDVGYGRKAGYEGVKAVVR